MAKKSQLIPGEDDPRIYADFQRLIKFKYMKNNFTLTPYDKSAGLMSGRHVSKFRGRGLNFEEFRHYQEGDDIRSMDWRVTMRTRQPYVRVYSEEKDLPVVLLVDQRKSMFFSSQDTMKSVIAAELASVCAWQVLKDTDRVGCMTFADNQHSWIAPQRSQQNTLQIIREIEQYNRKLGALVPNQVSPSESLNHALKRLNEMKLKGALVLMFSDFKGLDEKAKAQLQAIQSANDVLGIRISDPLEHKFKDSLEFYATDGDHQVAVSKDSSELATRYKQYASLQREQLKKLFTTKSTPYIEIGTDGLHVSEFQLAMGGK
ncbi:DUF58 domain-containing protein [Alginatibacterium sediminis]|uniref:DUF58 domain-containing protein n=1 Tax=Alginatibacterium sediminis TaxID=2164068 RepID=A0A420EI48_9ALTE|nr:DUF58 domain-containing protein [Alginatibacterium sediminis]RKF20358.1 DUF58 domain-containing protein [Alginatibacterium sediminis]